jgi:hypothetical protein
MTTKKPAPPAHFDINPLQSYRLNDPVSVAVTGLAPSQQREAAEAGHLAGEEPVSLTASAKAPQIWVGQQLINIQTKRLADARARAERRAAERASASKKIPEVKHRNCKHNAAV